MSVSDYLQSRLMEASSGAQARVLGERQLENNAEAELLIAVIQAYGNRSDAFIYVSPTRALATTPKPDLFFYHPDVGLVTMECKGHYIDEISGIQAGYLQVSYNSRPPVNVVTQASRQMFEISNEIGHLLTDPFAQPLLNYFIAFPNIKFSDWQGRGYDKCIPSDQLLFSEELEDPSQLCAKVAKVVDESMRKSSKSSVLTDEQLIAVARVFGNSNVINEAPGFRTWIEEDTFGSYIESMTNQRSYMSEEQKELARLQIDGSPRLIRGVAGSGKSVVLAELAIHYLCRRASLVGELDPEADVSVGVICFNRALVPFLQRKLEAALQTQLGTTSIPANLLRMIHLNSFMYWVQERSAALCSDRNERIRYIKLGEIRDATARAREYRRRVANFREKWPHHFAELCLDALFVDEAQDLEPDEFRLLLDFVKLDPKTGEKTAALFYDDAQNLYGRVRPVWEEIGLNVVGGRSRVMRECFRNSRQIVELAFNVLLGTQAPEEIRVYTRTYSDVAYLEEKNLVEDVDGHYRVNFAQRDEEPPHVKLFNLAAEEAEWIADEVSDLIVIEQVRPEDILIVTDSPSHARFIDLEAEIQALVHRKQRDNGGRASLHCFHAYDWNNKPVPFIFQPNTLTLASIYSAKGYDAPIVFLTNVHEIEYSKEGRALFYVGATRAKHRLYVSGRRTAARSLLHEAEQVTWYL